MLLDLFFIFEVIKSNILYHDCVHIHTDFAVHVIFLNIHFGPMNITLGK